MMVFGYGGSNVVTTIFVT